MSLKLCFRCGIPLKQDDKVKLTVYTVFKELKSSTTWAVSDDIYDADDDTLRHVDCPISRND